MNTQLLWDEYGMAAYLMTGAEQPLWNSYYNLKEALKTQKPKLVVLDMFCPSRFYDDFQPVSYTHLMHKKEQKCAK